MTIPADVIVTINPAVIGAGGSPLSLSAVLLTTSSRVPVGSTVPFTTATAVGAYFGLGSTEYQLALIYFAGFDGSKIKPKTLFLSQYPTAPVAAYLRGGSLASVTLAQLQAYTGVLTVTINGTVYTSGNINLSAATSFSNAATLIQAAFTAPALPGTVTYDSQSGAFVITSTLTGAGATIGFGSGTIAPLLLLGQANGAVTSQGAIAAVALTYMESVLLNTRNFASFMSVFEPSLSDKLAFAQWTNGKNNKYAYVAWDTDVNAKATGASGQLSFGYQATQSAIMQCFRCTTLRQLLQWFAVRWRPLILPA